MPVSNNPINDSSASVVEPVMSTLEPNEDIQNNYSPNTDDSTSSNLQGKGLSEAELNDPNSIRVTVADTTAPLVILFGPPACGKTMTLVRLARFLNRENYIVAPIRSFRPKSDTNYEEICDNFNNMMNSDNAASSTNRISFMLVEVIKNGRRICQILEAPGEYYFDPKNPDASFPNYVNTIISSSNRKVWTIMVEPDWLDPEDRRNYVGKITRLKQSMRHKDSVIFTFNKIDLTNFVRKVGDVNMSATIKHVEDLYPGIFKPFENENPFTKYFKKYNCELVPFQTGYYTQAVNGLTYQEGPKEYCVKLWNEIKKNI